MSPIPISRRSCAELKARRARRAIAFFSATAREICGSSGSTSTISFLTEFEGLVLAAASDRSRSSHSGASARVVPARLDRPGTSGRRIDVIVSDNVGGAKRLVEHLISVGHRTIAHITDAEDTSTGRERLQGYREALAANGIEFRSELVVRTTVDHIGGFRAAQEILGRHPSPTVMFAVNNMTAVGAMQALRERGLSVPEHMGLVCFDDVEHLAILSPFLTVVDQPSETLGSLGAQLLLERMSGKASERPRRIILQTNLIVRKSCCTEFGVPLR